MAAWIDTHPRLARFLFSLCAALVFCSPYFVKDFLPLEHDTLFHLSRIEGLAEAIGRGDFFPRIYPFKNGGFGYGSPMFYCDFLLIPFALLYRLGLSISFTYRLLVFAVTFCTADALTRLLARFTDNKAAIACTVAAFLFCNYRITDVYVRGALGETMAMGFLILLLEGLFLVYEERNPNAWITLTLAVSGLLLTHNLTALLGFGILAVFIVSYLKHANANTWKQVFGALVLSFFLTAWFTLPMLEQVNSQTLILDYYAHHSDLAGNALPLWKYFANKTIFGYSTNTLPRELQMTLNPGIFLSLAPLSLLIFKDRNVPHRLFLLVSLTLGYVTMILPCDLLPWAHLRMFSVMQFPWRFLTAAIVLLAIPACMGLAHVTNKKPSLAMLVLVLVLAEGIVHVMPVLNRTFGIDSSVRYEQLLDGSLIDPYYSATYMRVELAGGDYLPSGSVDFRDFPWSLKDTDGNEPACGITRNGTELRIELEDPLIQTIEVPLTYYPGYQAFRDDGTELKLSPSGHRLVEVTGDLSGTIRVVYAGTALQHVSLGISGITVLILIFVIFKTRTGHSA